MNRGKVSGFIIWVLAVLTGPVVCLAQTDYPRKPVEIVIPYAAGGATDLLVRIFVEKMRDSLGQPLIVTPKPGAATATGTTYVANAKPDGYVLLVQTNGLVNRPCYDPSIPFRYTQFKPIGGTATWGNMISVRNELPVKNLKELIDYARKNPGTLSYSVSGIGSTYQLMVEYLKYKTQLTDKHLQCIPYPGDLPALQALLGNNVQVANTNDDSAKPYVDAKSIRPIVIFSKQRSALLPDVPTAPEEGYPDLHVYPYYMWLAPAKTPDAVIQKLEDALQRAHRDKEVLDKLRKAYLPTNFMSSNEIKVRMDEEHNYWTKLIKEANLGAK